MITRMPAARRRLGVAEQVVRACDGPRRPAARAGRRARRGSRRPPRGPGSPSGCRRRRRRAARGASPPCVMPSAPGRRLAVAQPMCAAASRARASASSVVAPERRHVAHLAALEHASLVVEVEVDVGSTSSAVVRCRVESRRPRRALAEQVDHRGRGRAHLDRAERQPADRPDVLLELARRRALDRPVAAVVDARRELVDDERAVAHQEQLDGQRADEAHRRSPGARARFAAASLDDPPGSPAGTTVSTRIPPSWRLRASGNVGDPPSTFRATTTDSSASKSSSRSSERAASRAGRPSRSRVLGGRRRSRTWLRPS